jgi:hypothetical protein
VSVGLSVMEISVGEKSGSRDGEFTFAMFSLISLPSSRICKSARIFRLPEEKAAWPFLRCWLKGVGSVVAVVIFPCSLIIL